MPASTGWVPGVLVKEDDVFRNTTNLSAVLDNPVRVGSCSFSFYTPGLHCLQDSSTLGSGSLVLGFLFLDMVSFLEKIIVCRVDFPQ